MPPSAVLQAIEADFYFRFLVLALGAPANTEPTPFIWTKPAAAIIQSHKRMLAHIS